MDNRKSGVPRILLILAVIFSMAAGFTLSASPALAASVTISATSGSPGGTITVTGSAFTPGETYTIIFAPNTFFQQNLTTTTAIDGSGGFSRAVTLPFAQYGQYSIRVQASTSGTIDILNFVILPQIELHVTAGSSGDTVLVNGSGFRRNVSVNILFNAAIVMTTVADDFGTLSQDSFNVPGLRSGTYNVLGSDTVATSTPIIFTVRTRLTAGATEGAVGDQITLNGSGFDYSSPVTLYWDSQIISSGAAVSDTAGNFKTNFTIPASARGLHTLRATDLSNRTAIVTFTVSTRISISPPSGTPGTVVTVNGRGFSPTLGITITFSGGVVATQPISVITDTAGSFTATFAVPNVIAGIYAIRAVDRLNSGTANFAVVSRVDIIPPSGNAGASIQLTGTGFTPLGKAGVTYDDQLVTTIDTNATGGFSVNFAAPRSKGGQHIIIVRDLNNPAISITATFTMESTPPVTPNLLSPAPDTQTSRTPKFTWSHVEDPSGVTYNLEVGTDAAFTARVLSKQALTAPEYDVTQSEQLAAVKKTAPLYWRVKAIDGAENESEWSATVPFYTQDSTPPGQPQLITPKSATQTETRPVFDWSVSTDPEGVTYTIQISRETDFSPLALTREGLKESRYQVGAAEQLDLVKKSSPYYWRVKAIDGAGNESDWSFPGSFYTQDSTPAPASAALIPENGAEESTKPRFDWADASDPSGVTYTLQVSLDTDFSRIVILKEGLTVSEYTFTELEALAPSEEEPPAPYFWRVKVVDGAGNESDWSSVNAFYVSAGLKFEGWVLYTAIGVGGLLLLALGVLIGTKIKPRAAKPEDEAEEKPADDIEI